MAVVIAIFHNQIHNMAQKAWLYCNTVILLFVNCLQFLYCSTQSKRSEPERKLERTAVPFNYFLLGKGLKFRHSLHLRQTVMVQTESIKRP